jgi:8-oxo-dGTP pyrophosphatase MutT (NUDIX family)
MREALAREALEEAGMEIDPLSLEHKLTMHRYCDDKDNHHERVGFYFRIEAWKGEIKNNEPHKCDDLRFFSIDNLPSNTIGHIRKAIECYRAGINYCEYDWEKKK